MPKTRDPENFESMRLKFRRAFTKLLKTSSWEKVTIKDICGEAGVSPGLFYYYYDSKETVMRDKYRAFDESFAQTTRSLTENSNLYESMFLYVRVYVVKCYEKGSNYISQMLKYYLDESRGDRSWQGKRGFFGVLIELIERAKRAGEISDSMPSGEMAHVFAAALRGQALDWCAAPESVDLSAHCRDLVRFFYFGWKQIDYPIFSAVPHTAALISPEALISPLS
ncbi:MAG: TetR/AcrR family transcriptional regulator [Spirochaetales bacterium]|nr:TetR/AcrR family transcriptional regulator [Spirochaetales bacterium]